MEVELFEQHIVTTERHSSKGNQLKWKDGEIWYKAVIPDMRDCQNI